MAILVIGGVGIWQALRGPATVVIVIRHAEKQSTAGPEPPGPPLVQPEGETRAAALAHVCGSADVRAIYHSSDFRPGTSTQTDYLRSERTARNLATAAPSAVRIPYFRTAIPDLVNDIRTNHRGQVVVVVAHTDTIPQIVSSLGGGQTGVINDDTFDRFFVVVIPPWSGVRLIPLRYGAVSPPP